MTDSTDIVERLRTARDDDHERGCQMRFALCSCGFDDKCAHTAGEAADTITALRTQLVALERQLHRKHKGEIEGHAACSIVAQLAAIIPLKDTIKATATGVTLIAYFQNQLAQLAEARAALVSIKTAWEALPGPRHYTVAEMQAWIVGDMTAAIGIVRAALAKMESNNG